MSLALVLLYLKGCMVGFAASAPLGPVGVLCIRRSLRDGFVAGVVGGIGAACADAVFCIVSAFGLHTISDFITAYDHPIRIVGGIFLLGVAWKLFYTSPLLDDAARPTHRSHLGHLVAMFFVTLMNPVAIAFFTLAFAALGISRDGDTLMASVAVAGAFTGALLWWVGLAGLISFTRSQKLVKNIALVNRASAILIGLCGLWALGSVVA